MLNFISSAALALVASMTAVSVQSASFCGYVNGEAIWNELAGRTCADAMAGARAAAQSAPVQPTTDSASSSRNSSSGLSEQDTYQLIQQTESIVTEMLESNEQERLENERLLEEELRKESERRLEDERRQAIEAERAQRDLADRKNKYKSALNDKSNNPWEGDAPTLRKGSQPSPSSSANTPPVQAKAKDPSLDYSGSSCEYFTRHSDDAHLNYHRDGATVAFGKNVYICDAGRWRLRTTTDHYWAPVRDIEASKLEN